MNSQANLEGKIREANQEVVKRMISSRCYLTDVKRAGDVIKGLKANTIFHSGPPVEWKRMAGPMRSAMIGAMLFEGWAKTPAEAVRKAEQGKVKFDSSLDHNAISCLCGATSESMPVFEVENRTFGNKAYIALPELGMQFGRYDKKTLDNLVWLKKTLAPTLRDALRELGGLEMEPIISQALLMGDECHDRTVAASCLFHRIIAPSIVNVSEKRTAIQVLKYMGGIDLFFLWPLMARAKAVADAAKGVEYSTITSFLAGNGTEMGLKVSSLGHQWFKAPSPLFYVAKYNEGFSDKDSNPEVGDSILVDMQGLGGGAMAAGIAHVLSTGDSADDAIRYTKEMMRISVGKNSYFRIPVLNFEGTPVGVDIRKVLETGISQVCAVGIAHKKPGIGLIGFGMVRVPMACYQSAHEAFKKKYMASA